MPDGVLDVLPDEAEAVHGGVWHAVHGYDVAREIGFERTGFFYGERSGFDPALVAGRDPRSFKLGPVFGRADEEAFGFLDAVLADTPEDAVFLDAFPARLGVFHRVARAAVEQAVEAGACAVDEVALFEQQRLDPAHGEVAQGSRARGSAADDDDVPVPLGIF